MNENVGASFGLSVLTVVFFAVVLYQPERRAAAPPGAAGSVATIEPIEALPPPLPVSPGVIVSPPSFVEHVAAARPAPDQPAVVRPFAVARPVSRRAPLDTRPPEPRGAFTMVRAGETLPDVARRVYGSARQARSLWMANRDVVDRADAAPPAGSLLRTP